MATPKKSKRPTRAIFMPNWVGPPPNRHPLAAEIEAFLVEHGMTPTFFGYEVMRDPAFVFELRGGRDLRGTTENKIRVQMAFYRRWKQFADPRSVTVGARVS